MHIVGGLILVMLGVLIFRAINRSGRELRRDQFHRRNESGVLEYATFDEAEAAQRKEGVVHAGAQLGGCLGLLLIVAGLVVGIGGAIEASQRGDREMMTKRAQKFDEVNLDLMHKCNAGDKNSCTLLCSRVDTEKVCHAVGLLTSKEAYKNLAN